MSLNRSLCASTRRLLARFARGSLLDCLQGVLLIAQGGAVLCVSDKVDIGPRLRPLFRARGLVEINALEPVPDRLDRHAAVGAHDGRSEPAGVDGVEPDDGDPRAGDGVPEHAGGEGSEQGTGRGEELGRGSRYALADGSVREHEDDAAAAVALEWDGAGSVGEVCAAVEADVEDELAHVSRQEGDGNEWVVVGRHDDELHDAGG